MLSQPAVKAHRHFHPATQVPPYHQFFFLKKIICLSSSPGMQQFESLDYDPYDSSETMKHASGKSSMVHTPPSPSIWPSPLA